MSESLGKISQRVTGFGIDLLTEQTEIVRVPHGRFENFLRFLMPAGASEKIDFPKTAERESAFAFLQAPLIAMK